MRIFGGVGPAVSPCFQMEAYVDFVEVQDRARDGENLWNSFFETCHGGPSLMVEMLTLMGDAMLSW